MAITNQEIKQETDQLAKVYIRYTVLTTIGIVLCIVACLGITFTQDLNWLALFIPGVLYSLIVTWFMFKARKKFYSHVQLIPVHESNEEPVSE